MAKIIVEILGGVLQNVTSDMPGHEIMVVDYDNIAAGDAPPTTFEPISITLGDIPNTSDSRE